MNWLYNLSIKSKIILLTSFQLVLMLSIVTLAVFNLSELNDEADKLYQQELLGLSHIKDFRTYQLSMVRASRNILLAQQDTRLDVKKYQESYNKQMQLAQASLDAAVPLYYSDKGKALMGELKSTFANYQAEVAKTLALAEKEVQAGTASGNRESVYVLLTEVAKTTAQLDKLVTEASELKEANAKKASEHSTQVYQDYRNLLILLVIVAAIIGISLGLLIANRMSNNAKSMIRQLEKFEREVCEVVLAVNQQVSRLAVGDVSGQFNYTPLTCEQGQTDGDEVGAAVQSVRRMTAKTNKLFLEMQYNFNVSLSQLSSAIGGVADTMNALKQGNFAYQSNVNAHGVFAQMIATANQTTSRLRAIVTDLNSVISQMSAGDFSGRVSADCAGDLLEMKIAINESMENTAKVISSIANVVDANALGDLTAELPSGVYKGQFHDLKNSMSYSAQRVKESVIKASSASLVVSQAATQVSQGASDLSSRVQEQAAALEQISATMHQITSAVQANTANSSRASELTQQVQEQATGGVQVMEQTISAMQSIQESSSKISDIVTIIDGIAFQTNLLALNAAVEAARAGEHGRGFAVVASEVRALAGKSAEAAKDIKGLIEDSVSRIHNGTQLAEKSGEVLNTIAGSINDVSQMISEIANANKEQSIGINQVHLAIADIDRVTQENAALVEETTAAAESLSQEANELLQNMSFFKTGQNNHSMARKAMPSAPAAKAAPSRQKTTQALPSPKASSGIDEWNEF